MQTVRSSDVIERRGIPTITVTQEQFVTEYRRDPDLPRRSFESSCHNLSQSWERLKHPGIRCWTSPTPASSRAMAAAWHWALHLDDLDVVGSARASCVLPPFQFVRQIADNRFYCILSPAKWGALALRVERISERVFLLSKEQSYLTIVHATRIQDQFMVVPTSVCSPARLRVDHPGIMESCICYYQDAPEVGLLKHLFSHRVTVSNADLLYIAGELKLPHRRSMNKKELVDLISRFISNGLPPDAQDAFAKAAVVFASDLECDDEGGNSKVDHLVDDDLEEIFDLLGDDNKEEFKEFKDSIKTRKVRNKIAAARSVIHRAAKAKAKPKGKAKAKSATRVHPPPVHPPPPVAPLPAVAPPPVHAPALPPPDAPPAGPGLGTRWGPFSIVERMPSEGKPWGSVYARCPFHDTEPSRSGVSSLHCTKEWAVTDAEPLDILLRKLKLWCISGKPPSVDRTRKSHMSIARTARHMWAGNDPPTDADLNERRHVWDEAAVALGIPLV